MPLWPFGKNKKTAPVGSVAKAATPDDAPPQAYKLTPADSHLLVSAWQNNVEGIKASLEGGANVNAQEPYDPTSHQISHDYTPLMFACSQGADALEAVKLLLEAGADVSCKTFCNMTALLSAATASSMHGNGSYIKNAGPVIDALVAAGADVNDQESGLSALGNTINRTNNVISVSAVKALLKHGADPNRDPTYPSLLSAMCGVAIKSKDIANYYASMEAIKAMVEAGADVNPPDLLLQLSETPLGLAVTHGALEMTQYLLAHGANADVVDERGTSLLETVRTKLASQMEQGEPIEQTLTIIAALEDSILRTPDGKGQGGGAAQQVKPHQTTREII